jgi:hypothetical protein
MSLEKPLQGTIPHPNQTLADRSLHPSAPWATGAASTHLSKDLVYFQLTKEPGVLRVALQTIRSATADQGTAVGEIMSRLLLAALLVWTGLSLAGWVVFGGVEKRAAHFFVYPILWILGSIMWISYIAAVERRSATRGIERVVARIGFGPLSTS